ncbi:MAG: MFS transporter [Methanoregula sp.]|uniref:MFS transporter n=1 Tax=Methanoregula sp. TaxID=2052170 RepID=UPI003C709ADF
MPVEVPATIDAGRQDPAICRVPALPVTATEKRIVLLIAILAGFLTPFDGSAVNIALPTIGTAFHMDAIALSWVATAYILASALFLVPFGKLADIYGRKKIFLSGICLFGAASLVMTLVATEQQMISVRVIQGIGAAMIFGTSLAILTAVYPPGERGKALGLYISAVYLGLTLGPFFGGILTDVFGWRSIFYINVPIAIAAAILILWKLKGEWAECTGEKFDIPGSLLYSVALVAIMYGFSVLPDITGGILLVTGVVLIGVFIWYEQRLTYPVLNMQLFFKSRIFAFSNIAALINYSATYAVAFLLSLDLQYTKGFSAEYAGFIIVAAPFVQMIVSPFAGRLSDRYDSQIISSVGMGFTALGLFLLIFLTETTPLWYIIMVLMILGLGFGLFSSPNTNAIMSAVEKKYYGVASGLNGTMRLLGQMLSMGIAMMLFAIIIGQVEITPAYYPQFTESLHWAFILFTIMCVIGIFASLARGKRGGQKPVEG